jgi:type II secretory pathway pseudopilin PulG
MRERRAGFVLLELILVMLLLVLMVGLVAPAFSGSIPSAKLSKAVGDLHAVILKVRADAAITVRRYRLNVDATQQAYWVEVEQDPLSAPGLFVQPGGALRHVFRLPEDVAFLGVEGGQTASGLSAVVFLFGPDGTVQSGTIVLGMQDGAQRTLILDGATSNVEVTE